MEHPYIPELRVKFSNLNKEEKALVVDIVLSRIPVIFNIYEFLGDRRIYSDKVYMSYYKRGWTLVYADGTWWFYAVRHRKERYEPAKGRHPKPYG